jgi:hypothetical protein
MKQVFIIAIISYPLFTSVRDAAGQRATTIDQKVYVSPYKKIEEGQSLLKEGDLVVRLNRNPSSSFIKNFNRKDKNYSHAGIVLVENGYPYIFHIVDGEENPDEKLRVDSLMRFCNPAKNSAFGIFRYNMTTEEISELKAIVHKLYRTGVRFDGKFDMKSDDRMYCSEMISKALTGATRKRILIESTKMSTVEASFFSAYAHLPLSYTNNLNIIPIDALYMNPFCHPIKKYTYDY